MITAKKNKKIPNFEIFKHIIAICKKDVYYTLFFISLIYSLFYIPVLMFDYAYIEDGDGYAASFVICKWLIFISSALTSYKIYKENNKSNYLFIFGSLTVIFNTIFKIPFDESQWFWLIITASVIYLHFSIIFYFVEKNPHVCSICNLKPKFSKIFKIHIYKGGFNKGGIHYDGETYICKNCIDECVKCEKCGQLIMTDKIKKSLGEWESTYFCQCDK